MQRIKKTEYKDKKKNNWWITGLFLLAGLLLMCFPLISDRYNDYLNEVAIEEYQEYLANHEDKAVIELREQAEAYNARIGGYSYKPMKILPYDEQLILKDNPMMGYIEIPAIGVNLPIYHGSEKASLQVGVGHVDTSSLPVGGQSSHCVLSAHTAMRGQKMFDDLPQLRVGDEFTLHVLGREYYYRIYDTEVVLPSNTAPLELVPGRDLCTLLTCYPYGVNTHRLLVHAERVEDLISTGLDRTFDARLVMAVVGCVAVPIIIIIVIVRRRQVRNFLPEHSDYVSGDIFRFKLEKLGMLDPFEEYQKIEFEDWTAYFCVDNLNR